MPIPWPWKKQPEQRPVNDYRNSLLDELEDVFFGDDELGDPEMDYPYGGSPDTLFGDNLLDMEPEDLLDFRPDSWGDWEL